VVTALTLKRNDWSLW